MSRSPLKKRKKTVMCGTDFTPASGREKHRGSCEKKLEKLIPEGTASSGTRTVCKVVENFDPALGIDEAAERFGTDAICIGTHGHTGLGSSVLGSTAMALLHLSGKPIYLVRSRKT